MRLVKFSAARKSLKKVLDATVEDADVTVILRRNRPHAVVMSRDRYNSIVSTLHLLSNSANVTHLALSIKQYRNGEGISRQPADC